MITFGQFERLYPDASRARSKYVSALLRFGKFGGSLFGNKRPGEQLEGAPKRQTTTNESSSSSSSSSLVVSEGNVHVPRFDSSLVDEYGFVKSIDLRTCDVPADLACYLPSVELAEFTKTLYKYSRDGVMGKVAERERLMEDRHSEVEAGGGEHDAPLDFEGDKDIIRSVALFRQMVDMNFSLFFLQPKELLARYVRPDMSFPVYLRDHCSSKSIRELTACVPRIYYHFGAHGVQAEHLMVYLHHVPGFNRVFPYRILSSRAGNLFEVSARDFFTNDNFDVAQYSIKTRKDAFGEHGLHARFAVKDRARRRILLFDPHGDFNVKDKYTPDFLILNRALRSITNGIRVKVLERVGVDRAHVQFYGFPELHGFWETIKNVHVSTLFASSSSVDAVPADEIRVDQWYTHKLPAESVHGFTSVERGTQETGYEGDQPSEGTCALVALMRAAYVAQQANLRPLSNPLDFVRDEIPCSFAVFVSMLAQAFSVDEDNFNEDMLDMKEGQGIFVSVDGIQDRVWVYRLPTRKTTVPALKVVRLALSRIAMTRSVSMNPYRYRIKLVYPLGAVGLVGGVRYVPIDSKVDMTCVDVAEDGDRETGDPCRVVIEPLPENVYNVSVFVRRAYSPIDLEQMQEVVMSMEFARTKCVKDMQGFLTAPPSDPERMLVVMQVGNRLLTGDTSILQYFDPSQVGSRPEVRVIEKPRTIQVLYNARTWTIQIDSNTRVREVIAVVVPDLSEAVRTGVNLHLTYEGKSTREYFFDDIRMSTLNTELRFTLVRLHILPPDAQVTVRYYASKYDPASAGSMLPSDVCEVKIPIGPKSTIKDVKREFEKTVADGIKRMRLTTSFTSFNDVASDTTRLYPDFDRTTLYYY